MEINIGGDVSLSCLNRLRMVQQFETKSDAEERTRNNKENIEAGRKRRHNPVGNLVKYEWQSEECLSYVNNLDDGSLLNFSELTRTVGLKDNDTFGKDNKKQVVKQFLVNNGVDIDRFSHHKRIDHDQFHVRRNKLKLNNTDGNVSIPTDPCLDEVKRNLHQDILDGKYEMGELIVPIKFWKIIMVENELVYKPFEVEGRKTLLDITRREFYDSHKSYTERYRNKWYTDM